MNAFMPCRIHDDLEEEKDKTENSIH